MYVDFSICVARVNASVMTQLGGYSESCRILRIRGAI